MCFIFSKRNCASDTIAPIAATHIYWNAIYFFPFPPFQHWHVPLTTKPIMSVFNTFWTQEDFTFCFLCSILKYIKASPSSPFHEQCVQTFVSSMHCVLTNNHALLKILKKVLRQSHFKCPEISLRIIICAFISILHKYHKPIHLPNTLWMGKTSMAYTVQYITSPPNTNFLEASSSTFIFSTFNPFFNTYLKGYIFGLTYVHVSYGSASCKKGVWKTQIHHLLGNHQM